MRKLLFILVTLLSVSQGARADNVAQAIWCSVNSTLYFDYCAEVSASGTYNGQNITAVYTVPTTNYKDSYPGWSAVSSDVTTVEFKAAFKDFKPFSCYGWFHNFSQLEAVNGLANLNTSEVTNMDFMFDQCINLQALDVSTFDVSKVTTAASMFFNCSKLTTIYCNKAWSISSTESMFHGASRLPGYNESLVTGFMATPAGYFTSKLSLTLSDNADNTSAISTWAASHTDEYANVTLSGRTFKAGKMQTVCLPFDPSYLLEVGTVWAFTDVIDVSGNKKIEMTEQSVSLSANTPYIFQTTSDQSDVVFRGVKIINNPDPKTEKTVDATTSFTFHGTYAEKTWEATDAAVTSGHLYGFMMQTNDGQEEGQFVKARRKTILRPFSCYLEYNGDLTGTTTASARRAALAEGDELPEVIGIVWVPADSEATGIDTVPISPTEAGSYEGGYSTGERSGWYSLDGRKLNGEPTKKGLYIHNGKKVVK